MIKMNILINNISYKNGISQKNIKKQKNFAKTIDEMSRII